MIDSFADAAEPLLQLDEYFSSLQRGFDLTRDLGRSGALTLAIRGAMVAGVTYPDTTITLVVSTTTYVEAAPGTSTIVSNTSGYTSGNVPIGVAITDTDGLSSWRQDFVPGGTGGGGGGGGSGSVTSVGLTMPSIFSTSGSPVTGAGTLGVTFATQAVNLVFAGPASGAAAVPTFRALVAADLSFAGAANGVATLDSTGKVPTSQLPASVGGAMTYQGTWNAATNTPTLTSGTGTKGYLYKVATAGTTTLDGISSWSVGDSVVFDGATWDKLDGIANEVVTVAGLSGAITATALKTALAIVPTDVGGIFPVAQGGTGTSTPSIVAGTNVTVAGTWPNQTISASGSGPAGPGYAGTSTTSNTLANTGSQTFTTQAGLAYLAGLRVRLVATAATATYEEGVVSSYNGTTGALVVALDRSAGTAGTYTAWNIGIVGDIGTNGTGMTTKGDLSGFSTAVGRIAVGATAGMVMTVDSTNAFGVKWGWGTRTTKGDIEGFSTVGVRIPIGTNGQVLTADSTTAAGLKWATPAGSSTVFDFEMVGANNSTVFTDSGPNAIIATAVGGAKITSNRLALATAGDYLSIAHRGKASFDEKDFQLSFLFKTSQTQQYTCLMSKQGTGGDGSPGSFLILINDTAAAGTISIYGPELGSPFILSSTGGFANNVEHALVLTRVGGLFTLKIDGTSVGTATLFTPIAASAAPIYLGNDLNNAGRQLVGTIGSFILTFP